MAAFSQAVNSSASISSAPRSLTTAICRLADSSRPDGSASSYPRHRPKVTYFEYALKKATGVLPGAGPRLQTGWPW